MSEQIEKRTKFATAAIYGAMFWAAAFAVLHFAWALGWHFGLSEDAARKAFEQKWFLAYDIIAGVLCLLGAFIAFKLIRSFENRRLQLTVEFFALVGTAILILRAAAGIIQSFYLLASGKSASEALAFWDLWFCLGAILFGASCWSLRQTDIYEKSG